jgi:hypothetical protein
MYLLSNNVIIKYPKGEFKKIIVFIAMKKIIIIIISLLLSGCSLTPVPKNIEQLHRKAKEKVNLIQPLLKQGDIVFRLSSTQLLGGLVDFSKTIAEATESDFSHAVMVSNVFDDGAIVADITNTGIARRYLIDWYMDGPTTNVVVKRLKLEYQSFLPAIIKNLKQKIDEDVLYDTKFNSTDNKYYCTELVDECFTKANCQLADRIKIKDFPKYNLVFVIGCFIGGIDVNSEVVVVGNNKIGLFSSKKLESVIDLRNQGIWP